MERLLVGLLDREVLLTDVAARQDRPAAGIGLVLHAYATGHPTAGGWDTLLMLN